MNHNQVLMVQAMVAYGLAIHELQKALRSDILVKKTETLAACMSLALYEVRLATGSSLLQYLYLPDTSQTFESTANSVKPHGNHLLGIAALVQRQQKDVGCLDFGSFHNGECTPHVCKQLPLLCLTSQSNTIIRCSWVCSLAKHLSLPK